MNTRSKPQQRRHKLKPSGCPFCGKAPSVFPVDPEGEGDAWGQVECVNGKCPVQPKCRDGSKQADDRGSGAYKDLAIRRWNRRAQRTES